MDLTGDVIEHRESARELLSRVTLGEDEHGQMRDDTRTLLLREAHLHAQLATVCGLEVIAHRIASLECAVRNLRIEEGVEVLPLVAGWEGN